MYFTFPGVWILGNGPHEFPPNVEEIYGRDSQRDAKPQAGLLVCSRLSNCTFPRLSVTSCWCFCLLWRPGQDSNNYTQPHLSPNHRTHTHTHINYLLLFTCGQVCVYVCVFMAYAELKLTALLWGYIQSFSSIFHISVQFYLHSTN